jgi:hypothetical protein
MIVSSADRTKHAYVRSGEVSVTVGKQAFDSSETPTSSDQMSAGPVLVFKAPPGTVFLLPVEIAIPIAKGILDLLASESDGANDPAGASRRLLATLTTTQELKQAWFNSATKVTLQFLHLCVLHKECT